MKFLRMYFYSNEVCYMHINIYIRFFTDFQTVVNIYQVKKNNEIINHDINTDKHCAENIHSICMKNIPFKIKY